MDDSDEDADVENISMVVVEKAYLANYYVDHFQDNANILETDNHPYDYSMATMVQDVVCKGNVEVASYVTVPEKVQD